MTAALLDTNIVSYLLDPSSVHHAAIRRRATAHDGPLAISVLTLFELELFAQLSNTDVAPLRGSFRVVSLQPDAAPIFADLKIRLSKARGARPQGLARHNVDLALAATAVLDQLLLVSHDAIFQELAALNDRLSVVDWTEA